jgi:hypothetical protein
MMEDVYICTTSLRYGDETETIRIMTRQQYAKLLKRKKAGHFPDDWIHRVTPKAAAEIDRQQARARARKQYDERIMEKYNVPANYRENRWFMEQVRPTV